MAEDTIPENNNVEDRFYFLRKWFTLGTTPFNPEEGSYLYNVYRAVVVFCAYLTLLTTLFAMLKNLDDMDYVMESARPFMPMFNVLWIHFFMSLKMAGVSNLVTMANNFAWPESSPRDGDKISYSKSNQILRIQKLGQRGSICIFLAHSMYLVLRNVANGRKTLIFNAWVPFDADTIFGFSMALLMQAIGCVLYSHMMFGFIALYASLLVVGCTQLEMLQNALLNIKQDEDEPYSVIKDRLNKCLTHHQQILRYLNELEATFYLVLLGPFLSVAVTLCFSSYSAIVFTGNSVELIQPFLIIVAMLCQVQIFCWLGNELTIQSGRVRDAVWESNWVGTPVSHQRSLAIMMLVSKDFTLTAGKFIPVARRTVMLVLNETYSYLMFLLNFTNK